MRQTLLLIIMTFIAMSCSEKETQKIAIVKGDVLSEKVKQIKFEWILDNSISGKYETYIADIDSSSHFSIEIPIERLATGRISIGRFSHDICLIPGDDFYVIIDADTISYSGKGAAKNNYIYSAEINGLSDRAYYKESNKGELSPNDFLEVMLLLKQKRIDFLKSYQDDIKLQKEYVDYYQIETQVLFENLIHSYPRRYTYRNNTSLDSIDLPYEFKSLANFSNFVDDKKVISANYIHNLRNLLFTKAAEITKADPSINRKEARYVAMFDSLSGKTREYVLTKWICSEFSRDNYDSLAIEKFNQIETGELANTTFKHAFAKFEEKRSLIDQPLHLEFLETQLLDTVNNQVTLGGVLSNLKGNVVYLDLWGMGCGPCRAAMPYAKKLKDKLSEEPVEFLYLSTQSIRKNNWEAVFEATYTKDNHYVMKNGFDSRMLKFMEINWVPNYMIIDKEGNLVDFNANRPSRMIEQGETDLERKLKELAAK